MSQISKTAGNGASLSLGKAVWSDPGNIIPCVNLKIEPKDTNDTLTDEEIKALKGFIEKLKKLGIKIEKK